MIGFHTGGIDNVVRIQQKKKNDEMKIYVEMCGHAHEQIKTES